MTKLRLFLIALVIFVFSCSFAAGSYIKVYHQSQSPNADEDMPFGQFQTFETSGTVSDFPCAREGKYFMEVGLTGYQTETGSDYDAQGKPCKDISGNYKKISNCYAYTIDYDNNRTICAKSPSCFRDASGNEFNAVWDPLTNNGKGLCCGDDSFGVNPAGTVEDVDDPDMGKESCERCSLGRSVGSRYWFDSLKLTGNACCGDDINDCALLMSSNKYLCWDFNGKYQTSSSSGCDPVAAGCNPSGPPAPATYLPGKWYWSDAAKLKGDILNVSCAGLNVVSNGNEWLTCTDLSFTEDVSDEEESYCVYSIKESVELRAVPAGAVS